MIAQETLIRLELEKILTEIANNSHSDITTERLLSTVPFTNAEQIKLVSGRIEEIRKLQSLGIPVRLSQFENIIPVLETLRPTGAFLPPQDLLLFIPVLQNFQSISSQFSPRNDIVLLKSFNPPLKHFPELLEPLEASIDHDGTIKDSASSQLREIRRAKRSLAARIRKKIEEIVRDNNIEIFLQDDFITQRSGRWVIPVRMDSKGMVKGVVHDVSSSGETAFMEPLEIIPFVNELENLTAEEKAEEIRILKQLSAWIREDAPELAACFETLVQIDMLTAMARYADLYSLEKSELNSEGRLELCGARHPLLLSLRRQGVLKHVEPLDLKLGDGGRIMVITGPNAGGKTIALKTAGILTLMALCGLPVPAESSRTTFPLLDTLLVDIGDEQSIEQSHSTFSSHVARIATILEQAGKRSLVLLDELGAGTEPQQGGAIACGVLRELLEKGAAVIATTHLSEIIGFVHRTEGMLNAGMEYDATTYTPLYRLITGEPGHSHAIEIAGKFGMPQRVIDFARSMLGSGGEEFTSLLAELHRKREEMEQSGRALELEREQLRNEKKEIEARAQQISAARREAREKAWAEARELISVTRRRMNELLDEYKREKRSDIIDRLRQSEQEMTQQLRPADTRDEELVPLQKVKNGDSVMIRSLGHNGVVIQADTGSGKARVRAGSMELEVPLSDLLAPRKKAGEKPQRSTATAWKVQTAGSEERELKLIGLRVDEALDIMETFLNDVSLGGLKEVRIIHGMGTGRLRNAVREHLARHPLVEGFRTGNEHEGRDGATVVTLKA